MSPDSDILLSSLKAYVVDRFLGDFLSWLLHGEQLWTIHHSIDVCGTSRVHQGHIEGHRGHRGVYLKKHLSQPRTYSLTEKDAKMVKDSMRARESPREMR